MNHLRIYTDGSCIVNQRVGGWAAILVYAPDDLAWEMLEQYGDFAPEERDMRLISRSPEPPYTMQGSIRLLGGAAQDTTNNRMELTAVIQAAGALNSRSSFTLFTDSTYVAHAVTEDWLSQWRLRDWRDVKNRDLWEKFISEVLTHDVQFRHMPAHTNGRDFDSRMNDWCDQYARRCTQELLHNGHSPS